jgi:hypothetical protein
VRRFRTQRFVSVASLIVLTLGFNVVVNAAVIVNVYSTFGPNVSSPSFSGYSTNAINGIQAGGTTQGTAGTPTYWQNRPSGPVTEVLSGETAPNWMGLANPSAPFNNEQGTFKYFGVDVKGNGTQISLSELSFLSSSNEAGGGNFFGASLSFAAGDTYNANRVGILGSTRITSGSATQLVDEILYTGFGLTFDVDAAPPEPGTTEQLRLNAGLNDLNGSAPFSITGTYTVKTAAGAILGTGTATERLDPSGAGAIPEPGSIGLISLGLTCLLFARRKKR